MFERNSPFRLPWLVSEGQRKGCDACDSSSRSSTFFLHWKQGVILGLCLPPCTCLALGP